MARINGWTANGSIPSDESAPRAERRTVQGVLGLAVVVLSLSLLAGCFGGGKIPQTNYYVLDLPVPPRKNVKPLEATAILMPLRAPAMLTQDKIVYRPTRQEVGFYEYHRWAEDPRTLITHSLLDRLRNLNTFRQIVLFDGRTKGDYIIRGRVERLEEVDFEPGVKVYVKLSAKVIETESQKPIWQGESQGVGEVTVGEVRDVVSQMSSATQISLEKLAADLDSALRSRGSPPSVASSPLPPAEQR